MSKKKLTKAASATNPATLLPLTKYQEEQRIAAAHRRALPKWASNNGALQYVLHRALRVKRPADGAGEAQFVAWLTMWHQPTMIDGAGNLHFDLRGKNGSRTLFTSHTDTVHHDEGTNDVRVDHDQTTGITMLSTAGDDVLGADDGAGIALLCHMMSSGVAGYYIMFRGEECGGIGSSWLAANMPDLLAQFDRAVAFDRAGYHDVITRQAGGRCCSDEFGYALGDALSAHDETVMFTVCDGGVYTDTAEFVHIIPECTNLSVGYARQHTSMEVQDLTFLAKLADICCRIDWEALPTARDPRAPVKVKGLGMPTSAGSEWWSGVLGQTPTYGSHHGDGVDMDDNATLLWDALYEWEHRQHTYGVLCACATIAAPAYEDEQITGESLAGALARAWNHDTDVVLIEECYDMLTDGFDAVDAALSLVDSVLNRV